MSVRSYDNSNRAQKAQKTREAIVKTMVSRMATGDDDVSVADVAQLSGVSLRTVYQHFPDKAARVAAINAWIDENVKGEDLLPRGYADIPHYIERRVDYILQNETIIRAQMTTGLSKDVRSFRKLPHAKRLRDALRENMSNSETIDELVAVIICTVRAEAIFDMRDIYKLPPSRIKVRLRKVIELALANAAE